MVKKVKAKRTKKRKAKAPPALTTESVAIDSIKRDPDNARRHSKQNIDAIAQSLQRFGQRKPIVVGKDGVIQAGSGTHEAAKQLGWTTIEIARSPLTGAEARAFGLADNRASELADWDFKFLSTTLKQLAENDGDIASLGWEDHELALFLKADWTPPEVSELVPGAKVPPITLTKDQRHEFEHAAAEIRKRVDSGDLSEGECLMVMCGEYLS